MTKINWKIRFRNKAFVITFVTAIVALLYQILGVLNIVPAVSKDNILQIVMIVINLLVTLGIITDPTTSGVSDSKETLECDKLKDSETQKNKDSK